MRTALILAAAIITMADPVVTCRVGSGTTAWTGTLADVAAIESVHQREQAEGAGLAHPNGAPTPSLWSSVLRCSLE